MININSLFDKLVDRPVVLVTPTGSIQRFYHNIYATSLDHFDPRRVLLTCTHTQKKHKGKIFQFAGELDPASYTDINPDLNGLIPATE